MRSIKLVLEDFDFYYCLKLSFANFHVTLSTAQVIMKQTRQTIIIDHTTEYEGVQKDHRVMKLEVGRIAMQICLNVCVEDESP